jgi:YD repeat-containing protein
VKNDLELNGLKGKVKSIYNLLNGDLSEEYDKDGYFIFKTEVVGNRRYNVTYKRDASHNIVKEIRQEYNENKTRTINYKNKYDNEGYLIECKTDAGTDIIKYKYDEKKRLIEKTNWYSIEKDKYVISTIVTYAYDDNDNLIFERSINSDNFDYSNSYIYDSNNAKISANINGFDNHTESGMFKYKYDKNGNLISEESIDGSITKYEYEFDSKGNWVKRIIYFTSDNVQIERRRIVYYGEEEKKDIKIEKTVDIPKLEKEVVEGSELKDFITTNKLKVVYLNVAFSALENVPFTSDTNSIVTHENLESIFLLDTLQITDNQIRKLKVKSSKYDLALKFVQQVPNENFGEMADLFDNNNFIPDVSEMGDFRYQKNTGKFILNFTFENGRKTSFFFNTEGGYSLKGYFSVDSGEGCEYTLTYIPSSEITKKNSGL